MYKLFALCLLFCYQPGFSQALESTSNGIRQFDDYSIHYSIVNSEVIKPEVASVYNIVRSKRLGILTVVVIPNGQTYNGTEVLIGGEVNNLLQQKAALNFKPIKEQSTLYYIAPFQFDHKEKLRFTVHVKANSDTYSKTITFNHSLYQTGLD